MVYRSQPNARNKRARAHTPLHRRRTKKSFGSSHTARPASTARRSREPRPRPAMFLPANLHRTAVELTREVYDKRGRGSRGDLVFVISCFFIAACLFGLVDPGQDLRRFDTGRMLFRIGGAVAVERALDGDGSIKERRAAVATGIALVAVCGQQRLYGGRLEE